MASRKDLLKAQSFTTGRLVASFVDRDPDNPTKPLKRANTATFVGIMLGVLLVAGAGLIGFLRPGNSDGWRNAQGQLVADLSSGLLFIYYESPDSGPALLPMADVASARLAMNSTETKVVKTDKLQGIHQDVMRGIPNAPRQLPPASQMNPYPFRTCSSAPDSAGQRYVTIDVGQPAQTDPTTLADDVAVVIQADDGEHFLVMNGEYHHLWRPGDASRSPVASNLPVITTGNGWLSALPAGLPIAPLDIDNRGGKPNARQVQPDMMIGSVAMVEATELSPEARYFIQLADGLAETSFLNMATELAFHDVLKTEPTKITQTMLGKNMSPSTPLLTTPGIPMGRPKAPDTQQQNPSVCATYLDPALNEGRTSPVITVGDQTPRLPAAVSERAPYRAYADYIDMEPLHGVLLQDAGIAADESSRGPTFLLTDGRVYGIPDQQSRQALGYAASGRDATPVLRLPGMMIKLVAPVDVQLSRGDIYPPLPDDFTPPS